MLVDDLSSVLIVEEMPVAEDGVAEGLLRGFIYGVEGEVAGGGAVGDVEKGVFAEAGGVVVHEAGEEYAAPGRQVLSEQNMFFYVRGVPSYQSCPTPMTSLIPCKSSIPITSSHIFFNLYASFSLGLSVPPYPNKSGTMRP